MAYAEMTGSAAARRHAERLLGPIARTALLATLMTTLYCVAKLLSV